MYSTWEGFTSNNKPKVKKRRRTVDTAPFECFRRAWIYSPHNRLMCQPLPISKVDTVDKVSTSHCQICCWRKKTSQIRNQKKMPRSTASLPCIYYKQKRTEKNDDAFEYVCAATTVLPSLPKKSSRSFVWYYKKNTIEKKILDIFEACLFFFGGGGLSCCFMLLLLPLCV